MAAVSSVQAATQSRACWRPGVLKPRRARGRRGGPRTSVLHTTRIPHGQVRTSFETVVHSSFHTRRGRAAAAHPVARCARISLIGKAYRFFSETDGTQTRETAQSSVRGREATRTPERTLPDRRPQTETQRPRQSASCPCPPTGAQFPRVSVIGTAWHRSVTMRLEETGRA